MELEQKELKNYFDEFFLKNLFKFYTKTTISKEIAEIELNCLLDNKEYKELTRILYG